MIFLVGDLELKLHLLLLAGMGDNPSYSRKQTKKKDNYSIALLLLHALTISKTPCTNEIWWANSMAPNQG